MPRQPRAFVHICIQKNCKMNPTPNFLEILLNMCTLYINISFEFRKYFWARFKFQFSYQLSYLRAQILKTWHLEKCKWLLIFSKTILNNTCLSKALNFSEKEYAPIRIRCRITPPWLYFLKILVLCMYSMLHWLTRFRHSQVPKLQESPWKIQGWHVSWMIRNHHGDRLI